MTRRHCEQSEAKQYSLGLTPPDYFVAIARPSAGRFHDWRAGAPYGSSQ
jgi:hypothetical protein